MNNLGAVLQRRGDLAEAAEIYTLVLQRKRRLYGNEHSSVATTLNNLAVVRRRQGELKAARTLYEQAQSILERTVEPGHPLLATTRRNLDKLAVVEEDAAHDGPVGSRPVRRSEMNKERDLLAANTNEGAEDDDVEGHGSLPNVNEAAVVDDDVEAHGGLPNVNETAAEDDE